MGAAVLYGGVLGAVKLKELSSAVKTFERALQLAKSLKDRAAENAIRRAIDDINCTLAKRDTDTGNQ